MILISGFYYEVILLSLVLVLLLLLHTLYFRPPVGSVYLRTGFGRQRILQQQGGFVLPFLHSLTILDTQTHSLVLVFEKETSLRTQDLLRVDLTIVASVRLLLNPDDVKRVNTALVQGNWQTIEYWWATVGKGQVATLIAGCALEHLHQQRQTVLDTLKHTLSGALINYGVELVALSFPVFAETLEQFYDSNNWMDVKGLALLERQRLAYRKQRHLQQCENELAHRRSNFETAMQKMEWERKELLARLQHIRFKAEADARAEQELEEIQIAKELALEMMQRDVALTRLQTEQELHTARVSVATHFGHD